MKISSLCKFDKLIIQCHDNPDADAIASGFVLYNYFAACRKKVRLLYSGNRKITKTNLNMMIEALDIPIEYADNRREIFSEDENGLLITIDCQYGAGNVSVIHAPHVAIIDHHQVEIDRCDDLDIRPSYGSCSTVVWSMLMDEGILPGLIDSRISTALYYGLFCDTNQFSEMNNAVDRDMYDYLLSLPSSKVDFNLITMMKNSNISLEEMDIAGIALLRRIINTEHHYAIVHANACDPNVLGLISDFLLQVDGINTCLVYNEVDGGLKLSVRSCTKEVKASELAAFLTTDIGSGGGQLEKAGGYISMRRYNIKYPTLHSEAYFSRRMNKYFDETKVIYADRYYLDVSGMKLCTKKPILLGYIEPETFVESGTPYVIRTLENDIEGVVSADSYIMIGIEGEVYTVSKERFEKDYEKTDEAYSYSGIYKPTLREEKSLKVHSLLPHIKGCRVKADEGVYVKKLNSRTKVFTLRDSSRYQLGIEGDYICVSKNCMNDIFIVDKKIFDEKYSYENR